MDNINAVIQEAAERLRIMHLHPNVLKEFKKDGTRYYSERSLIGRQVCGILYWLRNRPEWMKKIREIEEKRNIYVYAAIHEYASFGELLTLLYVSNYECSWADDRRRLETTYKFGHEVHAYTWNISEDFVEPGFIGIRSVGGGLIRTF